MRGREHERVGLLEIRADVTACVEIARGRVRIEPAKQCDGQVVHTVGEVGYAGELGEMGMVHCAQPRRVWQENRVGPVPTGGFVLREELARRKQALAAGVGKAVKGEAVRL